MRNLNGYTGAATGANTQFRILGGAVGLAIVINAFNSSLRPALSSFLDPTQLTELLQSNELLATLPTPLQEMTLGAFAEDFQLQWKALLAMIGTQVPAALLMWNR